MTVTAAEMKEIERKAAEGGLSYEQMMENAGRAVADFVQDKQPVLRTAAVFVGRATTAATAWSQRDTCASAACGSRSSWSRVSRRPTRPGPTGKN